MSRKISVGMKRFNYLNGELNMVYHTVAFRLGVSDSTMQILYTICNFGESCLLSDICRLTGARKQTVNSALRKLEKEGVLYLTPENGKSKRVVLTGRGKELAERTAVRLIAAENAVFDAWSKKDVENYLALTERYLKDIRRQIDAPEFVGKTEYEKE